MQNLKIIIFIAITFLLSFKTVKQRQGSLIEKIYTQTDRPLYFPGETIWFKSYITNAENKISTISDVMYADLISPKGTVAKSITLSVIHGYAYGDFQINEAWVGGTYTLRMYTNWMRNFGKEAYFEKEIVVQKVVKPNLLMRLEFEKKAYGKGAEVLAHFEVKDLKNIPLSDKKIRIEVQVEGKIILSKSVMTNQDGKQDVKFKLPDNLNSNDAILNVLIPYKSTTESISRSVPITLNKIDLQFFPESGKTIHGIENQIAFKALNEFGKPVDVAGEILDEKGMLITKFKSFHDGMGSFLVNPKGKEYYAKITEPFVSDSLLSLPKIHTFGTQFKLKESKENYSIEIYSNEVKTVQLSVLNEYEKLVNETVKLQRHKAIYILDKKKLTSGIIKISLHGKYNSILAERLIFTNKTNRLNVSISLDKEHYLTREKVKVNIKTTNQLNKPIPANLSISIADNKLVSFADDKQDNIYSYLLLSSELKGKIYKPSFYFDSNKIKADSALNYVMLTHGWRNYITKDTITFKNANFKPDAKGIQYGRVVDKNYKPIKAHLLLFDQNTNKVIKFDTNRKGYFSFKIEKNRNLVLLAYKDDRKKVIIIKGKFKQGFNSKLLLTGKNRTKKDNLKTLDIKKPIQETIEEDVVTTKNRTTTLLSGDNALEEVVITAYGYRSKKALSAAVVSVVKSEDITKYTGDISNLLQGRVSGVQIINNSGAPGNTTAVAIRGSSSISGNSQPLIVIDGVPFDGGSVLQNLEPTNIDNVQVLKGAAASAIYGCNGINGVVIITTINQNFNPLYGSKSLNNKKYKNYAIETFYNRSSLTTYNSKQFYIPIYNSERITKTRKDFRQTIYWNPVIQTDKNGEASFEYYNSDAITSFIITTEGIGYNGLIGRDETTYSTKKTLNIDFKTPAYMAISDTIELAVIITNDSDKAISPKLELELPNELQLIGKYQQEGFRIEPNSHKLITVTVMPIKKIKTTTITAMVTSATHTDTMDKEISILSPYFPMQASISGQKNESYEFEINNRIAGSLTAEFSIYTDIVGDVMDGIEGLIREPYGCFEQVSSSTYPNILILKYLKETNKSNPEIEKRALNFIRKGYKKLAAYETSKNGFEWYGDAPPHEALSAYGLMEFTEMKEVYEGVSQAMIKRTIKYLLERRNGRGGFKQNRGKYGFSAAPKPINNAYIVYAISESGNTVDISKEYDYTFNEALKSNDSYRMALLACASFNLHKIENANLLMEKIKENIKAEGFKKLPVENTITRSYGDSKQIETAAFTILALLKEKGSEYTVSQGIEYLISTRKNGRFGSTQATSMALKALIEYTKTQKQKMVLSNNTVEITINGKIINRQLTLTNDGKIVINGLEDYLSTGKQQLKVRFSSSEGSFPYMLNVNWDSTIPNSSPHCKLAVQTTITNNTIRVGDNLRMNIEVKNKTDQALPMAIAIIGIPSGTSAQPWQLKELKEQHKADYFEVFDNYLVFYWKEFDVKETKTIQLDLKAEVSGTYQAPASTAYLYYADDFKHWIVGNKIKVKK